MVELHGHKPVFSSSRIDSLSTHSHIIITRSSHTMTGNTVVIQETSSSFMCTVCGKEKGASSSVDFRLRRCSHCRGPERYCSVECQRHDWNKHKRLCRTRRTDELEKTTAQSSWYELQQLVLSSSLHEARQDFHKAHDAVQRLKKQESAKTKPVLQQPNNHSSMDDTQQQQQQQQTKVPLPKPTEEALTNDNLSSNKKNYPTTILQHPSTIWGKWSVYIAELAKLSCFQITIQCRVLLQRGSVLSLDQQRRYSVKVMEQTRRESRLGLFVEEETSSNNTTQQQNQQLLVCFDIPSTIEEALLVRQSESPRHSADGDDGSMSMLWNIRAMGSPKSPGRSIHNRAGLAASNRVNLATLYCRGCHDNDGHPPREVCQPLFLKDKRHDNDDDDNTLMELYRLPTGHWQDMVEYLSCSGQEDLLWPQDAQIESSDKIGFNEGFLSIPNKKHLDPRATCVIWNDNPSVEKDEDVATWKPSLLAPSMLVQKQLMCTRCWSQLGYCVEADSTNQGNNHTDSSSTVYLMRSMISPFSKMVSTSLAGFWANEMIHLAETQGTFTLLLLPDDHHSKGSSSMKGVWLRLWQWDSSRGISGESSSSPSSSPHIPIHWSPIAKVIYQLGNRSDFVSSSKEAELPLIGLGDWCCPPDTNTTRGSVNITPTATSGRMVTAFLPSWQIASLQRELQHTYNLLNESMDPSSNEATVMALFTAQTGVKLSCGDRLIASREAGIAHVPF